MNLGIKIVSRLLVAKYWEGDGFPPDKQQSKSLKNAPSSIIRRSHKSAELLPVQ
jgi:hypothetical protein